MTEAEWWACDDPRHMLGFLGTRSSDRKLRLFACAYARTGSWLIGMSAWCSGELLARRRDDEPLDAAWAVRTILDVRRVPARGNAPITFQGKPPWEKVGEEVVRFAEQVADGLISTPEFAKRAGPLL